MTWIVDNWFTILVLIMVAALMLRGPLLARYYHIEHLTAHDLANRMRSPSPPVVLDVRTPEEYAQMRIAGTVLLPLRELPVRLEVLQTQYPQREFAVICLSGSRSLNGAILLKKAGFAQVGHVVGGLAHWRGQGYPVVT